MLNNVRHMSRVLACHEAFLPRRYIFTQDYLGVTRFLEAKKDEMTKLQDYPDSRSTVLARMSAEPTTSILSDDINTLISTASSHGQIAEARGLIEKYLNEVVSASEVPHFSIIRAGRFAVRDFLHLCHAMNSVAEAQKLWNSVDLMTCSLQFLDRRGLPQAVALPVITTYLDLLFENKLYDDLLDAVDRLQEVISRLPLSVLTLAMLTCYHQNTDESYRRATNYMNTYSGRDESGGQLGRAGYTFALLACDHGDYHVAFETVSQMRHVNINKASLLIYILVKMNRIEDAMRYMSNFLKPIDSPYETKAHFSMEAIRLLTNAVKESGDVNLQKNLARLFDKLDSVAVLRPESLRELLFRPIDLSARTKVQRKPQERKAVVE